MAPDRSHCWPRSSRTQAGRCGLTDRRSSVKKLLSFVSLLMFPSLLRRRNHIARDACRVFKADVLRESKNSAWFPSSEIDERSWPLSVTVRALRGRVRLGERGRIGRRRRIHTEKTRTITFIDTRITRVRVGESK